MYCMTMTQKFPRTEDPPRPIIAALCDSGFKEHLCLISYWVQILEKNRDA